MRYALKITETSLPFVIMLNGGVEPEVEEPPTYLVVTLDGPDFSHNDILTQREFWCTCDIDVSGPLFMALKN